MGEAKIAPVECGQELDADCGGNTSQVAVKEDEPERDILSLGLQPGMPEAQEHCKGNGSDWSHAQLENLYNVESADHEHGFQRKNCS